MKKFFFSLLVLAVTSVLMVGNVDVIYGQSTQMAEDDLQLEAEYLVLQGGNYDKETLMADEKAVKVAKRMLHEVRKCNDVPNLSFLPEERGSVVEMSVTKEHERDKDLLPGIMEIAKCYKASYCIARAGDNIYALYLNFHRFLHTPSLVMECQKVEGVREAHDGLLPPSPDADSVIFEYNAENEMGSLLSVRRLVKREEDFIQYATFVYQLSNDGIQCIRIRNDCAGGFSEKK